MDINIPIYDITPFSTLDYPGHTAAIAWIAKCNMRCPYCHNPEIVNFNQKSSISAENLLKFLEKRVNLLEGVVLSGGECTLYSDIVKLCQKIKELGFKIKIDTNGSRPEIIKELCKKNLADYFAVDFKAPKDKFYAVTGSNLYSKLINTLEILQENSAEFEIKTTVHTDLLGESDINKIIDILKNINFKGIYFLQNFTFIDKTLGNIRKPLRELNLSSLKRDIKIEFRNFSEC